MTEYTPDEEHMEVAWIEYDDAATDINEAAAQFDRFLARVRRDAWNECAQWHAEQGMGVHEARTGEANPYREQVNS